MIRIAICENEKHMPGHIKAMAFGVFRKKNRGDPTSGIFKIILSLMVSMFLVDKSVHS